MKCRNGLHEIDPDDPWRGSHGERCRACCAARLARYAETEKGKLARRRARRRSYVTRGAVRSTARWNAKYPDKRKASYNRSNKKRRSNPVTVQMNNDCRRLGLSAAEWRRQVEQGIIQIKEK